MTREELLAARDKQIAERKQGITDAHLASKALFAEKVKLGLPGYKEKQALIDAESKEE